MVDKCQRTFAVQTVAANEAEQETMRRSRKRPVAYSYVRMSSRQQIKGDSLRRQLELSRAYASENDLALDDSLRDIGISAWTGANVRDGALGRFFELVQTGQIERGSYLLVESFDRLSRQQVRKSIGPIIDLINAGIILVTLGDRQVYSEATVDDNFAQLILSLAIMSRAHEESQTRSKRLKAAHEHRRRRAKAGEGRFSPQIWAWLDQIETGADQYKYIPNEHAATVRKIFEMAGAGLGHLAITRNLNHAGIPGFRGKYAGWQQATVSKILKNEAVIGTYQPTHRIEDRTKPYGDPIPDYLPAVVNDELFWRVQRDKRQRNWVGRKGARLTNIVSQISACALCKGKMMLRGGGALKNPVRYIRCHNEFRGLVCSKKGRPFRYDVVEKAILDNAKMFHQEQAFDKDVNEYRSDIVALIAENECVLLDLDKRRERLLALAEIVDHDEDREDVRHEMRARREQVESTKALLSDLRLELIFAENKEYEINEICERIIAERALWPTLSDTEAFESRAKVARALTRFIEKVWFNSMDWQFTVTTLGGLKSYTFNNLGELILRQTSPLKIANATEAASIS